MTSRYSQTSQVLRCLLLPLPRICMQSDGLTCGFCLNQIGFCASKLAAADRSRHPHGRSITSSERCRGCHRQPEPSATSTRRRPRDPSPNGKKANRCAAASSARTTAPRRSSASFEPHMAIVVRRLCTGDRWGAVRAAMPITSGGDTRCTQTDIQYTWWVLT